MATTKTNKRSKGKSGDRRKRRQNELFWWGDGITCPCTWCGRTLRNAEYFCGPTGKWVSETVNGKCPADHITVDHIITETEGGSYRMENLVPACDSCNKRRGETPFDDYCAMTGRDADALRAHAAAYRPRRKK